MAVRRNLSFEEKGGSENVNCDEDPGYEREEGSY